MNTMKISGWKGVERGGRPAYKQVVEAFRNRKKGATVADIAADTGLALYTVKELVPAAADEFSGRLEVTESGEILYSFPRGFTSRYRGFGPFVKNCSEKLIRGLAAAGKVIFKVWIMVMLIGYFLLFMAIALASLFISMAANSHGSDSRRRDGGFGGMYVASSIFNLIIRLWFYSELTKSVGGYGRGAAPKAGPRGKPLHRAIFSFVFGDGDPNAGWAGREKKSFIAYLKEHRGVVTQPEFMALTGLPPQEAEAEITALCAEFGGSPEVTEEGVIVYRFDEILRSADGAEKAASGGIPALLMKLKNFSSNPGKMNFWFALINGVNLLFGGYFFYNASTIGALDIPISLEGGARIYKVAYGLLYSLVGNPLPVIAVGLGVVPLAFSVLFWLIPLIRKGKLNRENEGIKMTNFRKFSFSRIWASPGAVKPAELNPSQREASPAKLRSAQEKVIREMGSYAVPDVTVGEGGEVYAFAELEREKASLEKYRAGINPGAPDIGKTIFDSEA